MNIEDLTEARALVAAALSVGIDRIGPEAKLRSDPAWDSLGQLSVMLAIEELLGREIKDEATFDTVLSIRGIAAFIASARTAPQDNP